MNRGIFLTLAIITLACVITTALIQFGPGPSNLHAACHSHFTIESVGSLDDRHHLSLITDNRTGRQYLAGTDTGMVEVNQELLQR